MIFRELIKQMQFEQNLSQKRLAIEVGISPLTLSRFATGKIKLPDSNTCKKIFGYCRLHRIDLACLDWNEIIYDAFTTKPVSENYAWLSDIEDGHILLRHFKCGKNTLAPINAVIGAIKGNGDICIHCWVKQHLHIAAYEYSLSECLDDHVFCHYEDQCSHQYHVTYEEIKQGEFRCPECYWRIGKDYDYGPRNDYRFILDMNEEDYWN